MKGGRLVVEHDVVGPGNAHDEVAAGHAEQGEQGIHVVFVGFGVVGVAHVHAHGQAQQLAAEMVFERRPNDLLAVVEVLGADEADHRIHQQRPEPTGHGVGPGLAGLLVEPVVGVGRKGAALACFEVHDVLAQRAAVQHEGGFPGFLQQVQVDAEAGVGSLRSGNGLEGEVDGRALLDELQSGRDMAQHARLRGNGVLLAHGIEQVQQLAHGFGVVGGGIDADDGVAAAVEQAVEQAGGDAARVVGGVVGLEARGQPPTQPQRVAKLRDNLAAAGHPNQLLAAHQLAHGRHHLRREAGRQCVQRGRIGGIRQQPVAQLAHGEMGNGGEGGRIVGINDEARYFVLFVGNEGFVQKVAQGHVGQRHLGGHALLVGGGSYPGQHIARAQRRGPRQQRGQVGKSVGALANGVLVSHSSGG